MGAVHLRLLGSCDGCPSSAVTLRTTVERAIVEAAPEIVTIDVEEPNAAGRAGGRRPPVDARRGSQSWPSRSTRAGRRARRAPAADPLSVLARIRDTRPRKRPRARRALRAVRRAHPRRARARRRPRAAQPDVHLPRLLPALRPRRRRRRAVPRRARPLPVVPRLRAVAGAVGRAADPGERRVLLLQLDASSASPPSTRARPARRSRCCPSTRGTRSSTANPDLATLQPDVEAFLVRARDARAGRPPECYLVPIDACYELVGAAAAAVAGLRRRAGGARRARRVLRPDRARAEPVRTVERRP